MNGNPHEAPGRGPMGVPRLISKSDRVAIDTYLRELEVAGRYLRAILSSKHLYL